jgi:hypothetical protein
MSTFVTQNGYIGGQVSSSQVAVGTTAVTPPKFGDMTTSVDVLHNATSPVVVTVEQAESPVTYINVDYSGGVQDGNKAITLPAASSVTPGTQVLFSVTREPRTGNETIFTTQVNTSDAATIYAMRRGTWNAVMELFPSAVFGGTCVFGTDGINWYAYDEQQLAVVEKP